MPQDRPPQDLSLSSPCSLRSRVSLLGGPVSRACWACQLVPVRILPSSVGPLVWPGWPGRARWGQAAQSQQLAFPELLL